jgi:hypothetical protein
MRQLKITKQVTNRETASLDKYLQEIGKVETVTAQTIYYNNQVETQNEQLNIAPGAVVERPVDEMVTPAIRIESSYQRMTPDKADRTSFQFGFAAIYRLAGTSTETTLYDFRNFNLGCTIDNMIRAGSCRYPTTESFSRSARN